MIRYIALGDSYTIGEGALPNEAWPNILVEDLKRELKEASNDPSKNDDWYCWEGKCGQVHIFQSSGQGPQSKNLLGFALFILLG